jgi:hypothetical protein
LVFKGSARALNGVKQRSHFSLKTESISNCLLFVKACAAFCGGFGEFQLIVALPFPQRRREYIGDAADAPQGALRSTARLSAF